MHKTNVAIATISWVRDAQEEKLLRASFSQLATFGIPVFITDGGSNSSFLDFLRTFPQFKILTPTGKGVWAQARTSVLAATETKAPFILYTEPDKLIFFRDFLPDFLSQAPTAESTGVVLASRSATGFATFPAFQRTTETTINACCTEIIGPAVDYTYGPFLMRRELAPYLNLVQEDIGWGWRPYVFGLAHHLGFEVISYEADLACPPDQREDSRAERIYRMKQLTQNIQGLVLSTTVALK
ncbi:hypothetical protein [Adhaeribacter rhizoryzae]|uniref:Glycosyltransferase n=1 Tax=Adhaeribacter rhizoryzae TaxID=2607907 RepID=A0A5M6DBD5_9BACT|nr:hypothetical protein [Adhaeribacter rhizoryzae]KAA5542455.1 hypothetical protein F0145_18570 [Adhaeribacter rhizoryzae]